MRLGKIALAFTLGFALTARAEDNVMIDLSVLDGLGSSYMAPAEPLFPVLPKKPKAAPKKIKKKNKPKIVKKAPVKKAPKIEPKVEVKVEPKVEVVDIEPVVVVDVEPLPEPIITQEQPTPNVVVPNTVTPAEEQSAEVVEPTENETTEIKPTTEETTEQVAVSTPVVEIPVNTIIEQPIAENTMETTVIKTSTEEQPVIAAPVAQPIVDAQVEQQPAEIPSLLIDENSSAPQRKADNSIVFATDVDELSAEQMAAIDTIIGRFKDTNTNKIAIYSYNLDDGVDSFRKKRLSLNRAIEVRSYLLKQGYKNFSIKVININAGSDKVNTVELEEI